MSTSYTPPERRNCDICGSEMIITRRVSRTTQACPHSQDSLHKAERSLRRQRASIARIEAIIEGRGTQVTDYPRNLRPGDRLASGKHVASIRFARGGIEVTYQEGGIALLNGRRKVQVLR